MKLQVSPASYSLIVPIIEHEANRHGYAIGLHGSMQRDLDIIAFPWIEHVDHYSILLESILNALNGNIERGPIVKPHKRIGFIIGLGSIHSIKPHIDLSIFLSNTDI